MRRPRGHWTIENLQEEASRYERRTDMMENSYSAYQTALIRGLLDTIFANHPNQGYTPPIKTWTRDELQVEANKYEKRSDFSALSSQAYRQASTLGIMDELFKNHPSNRVSNETIQEAADGCATRIEFCNKHHSYYVTAYYRKIVDDLFKNHSNDGYSDKPPTVPKKVVCDETGEIFDSIFQAASSRGKGSQTLIRHLRGKSKTFDGQHWKYFDSND